MPMEFLWLLFEHKVFNHFGYLYMRTEQMIVYFISLARSPLFGSGGWRLSGNKSLKNYRRSIFGEFIFCDSRKRRHGESEKSLNCISHSTHITRFHKINWSIFDVAVNDDYAHRHGKPKTSRSILILLIIINWVKARNIYDKCLGNCTTLRAHLNLTPSQRYVNHVEMLQLIRACIFIAHTKSFIFPCLQIANMKNYENLLRNVPSAFNKRLDITCTHYHFHAIKAGKYCIIA